MQITIQLQLSDVMIHKDDFLLVAMYLSRNLWVFWKWVIFV